MASATQPGAGGGPHVADDPGARRPERGSDGAADLTWLSVFSAVLVANLMTVAILVTLALLAANPAMNRIGEKLKEPAAKAK